MKTHVTKKKAGLIVCIVFIVLVAAAAAGYFGYGATLLDPNSDDSIKSVVSKERYGFEEGLGNKEVEILVKKQYGDYFAVLFSAVPPDDREAAITHLSLYKKHKYYKNRYVSSSRTSDGSELDSVLCISQMDEDLDSAKIVCYIGNDVSGVSRCTLLEADEDTPDRPFVRKVDEIALPTDDPYILVKEYEMQKPGNSIVCFDGSLDLSDIYGDAA